MTMTISAIYDNGVLIPDKKLEIKNKQKVQLIIIDTKDSRAEQEDVEAYNIKKSGKIFSYRKRKRLHNFEALVNNNLFDLSPLEQPFLQFFKRKVSLDKVKNSLSKVPDKYVDDILEKERNEL